MHTELEEEEARKILRAAYSGLDTKSLLSAHNIRLHDDVLCFVETYAALDMIVKLIGTDKHGIDFVREALEEVIIDNEKTKPSY